MIKRVVTSLTLHPASTSCRPACGQVVMADTEYPDGVTGPQISLGCQCKTSPVALLTFLSLNHFAVRSHLSRPSSCSVSNEIGGRVAGS